MGHALEFLLLLDEPGNIGEHRNVAGDVPLRIGDRRDRLHLDEKLARLAAIPDLAAPGAGRVDLCPHLAVEVFVVPARAQQCRVLAENLLARIAGDRRECRIDVDDPPLRIGNDDAVASVIEDARRERELLLGFVALGDVLVHPDEALGGAGVVGMHGRVSLDEAQLAVPIPNAEYGVESPQGIDSSLAFGCNAITIAGMQALLPCSQVDVERRLINVIELMHAGVPEQVAGLQVEIPGAALRRLLGEIESFARFADIRRHRMDLALHPPPLSAERPDDREEQQVDQQAPSRDQGGQAASRGRLKRLGAVEARVPNASGQGDLRICAEVRGLRRARLPAVVEQGFCALWHTLVVEFEAHLGHLIAENAAHQVVHAEWTVDKADQGFAAPGHRVRRRVGAIDRKVDQESGLHVRRGFLDQHDPAGHRRRARIARVVHGCAAHRVRVHVVTEGAAISPVEGLEIDDRTVNVAFSLGLYRIGIEAFRSHRGDMREEFPGSEHLRVADALDAGEMFLNPHPLDESAPFGTRYGTLHGIEEGHPAAQHLFVFEHAVADALHRVADFEAEAVAGAARHIAVRHIPAQCSDRQ